MIALALRMMPIDIHRIALGGIMVFQTSIKINLRLLPGYDLYRAPELSHLAAQGRG